MMDCYRIKAQQFIMHADIEDSDAQFKALVEEVGELAEALNTGQGVDEEIADVLVTAFVLAELEGVDPDIEYQKQMERNLEKSGKKEGGKVIDDA